MTDQYRDQYKKETAQVHAPMDLIERTKAAVREEEVRILRERMAQAKMSEAAVYVDEMKRAKGFAAHKWAYPLTAAAALLILVSVSLTMRSMKGNSSGMSGATYDESADAGFAESADMDAGSPVGGNLDAEDGVLESVAADGASVESVIEAAEEEMAVESVSDEASMEAAGGAETSGSVKEETASISEIQRSMEEKKQAASVADDMAQNIENAEAEKEDLQQKQEAAESLADSVAADGIKIEKVKKRPAFCNLPDTKTHVYEGKNFLVSEEKNGWIAYVETKSGTGYVLRGEAEELEDFLKAGYEKMIGLW